MNLTGTLLGVSKLTYRYSSQDRNLLEKVSFTVGSREKIGIVGPNGSGKTTLIKILVGELIDFEGNLAKPKSGLKIGYLPQDVSRDSDRILLEEVKVAFPGVYEVEKSLSVLEKQLESGVDAEVLKDYGELLSKYERMGGFQLEEKIKKVLSKFGFTNDDIKRSYNKLSGGEKTRVELAKILLEEPDLLILDEPTNHLDINSLEWLEEYLRRYKGAVLLTSHDRYFLDKIVTSILEIRDSKSAIYSGNYSFYIYERNLKEKQAWEKYEEQSRRIKKMEGEAKRRKVWSKRKEKEKIGAGDKGFIGHRAAKLAKRAKAVETRIKQEIEKEKANKPIIQKQMKVKLETVYHSGERVLDVCELSKAFGDKTLFNSLNFTIIRGKTIGIIGPNGSGKTTFIRILLGELSADSGSIRWGANVKLGYHAQEQENLNMENTILVEVKQGNPDETFARTILGCLKIRQKRVHERIKNISTGERVKVSLAKVLTSRPNVLILDEPTNHLDVDAREALENALADYSGTLIMASHDRYLIQKLADEILEINGKETRYFPGSYSELKSVLSSFTLAASCCKKMRKARIEQQ
ncbi:MAG: ribosomal protection-like ABC-F family protein [Alkaliphilus sp.]